MLIKLKSKYSEAVEARRPQTESPQIPTSPSNNPTFLENSTFKRVCPILF